MFFLFSENTLLELSLFLVICSPLSPHPPPRSCFVCTGAGVTPVKCKGLVGSGVGWSDRQEVGVSSPEWSLRHHVTLSKSLILRKIPLPQLRN